MYVYRSTCSTLLDQDENKCSRKINISFMNVYPQRSCTNAFSRKKNEFYESAQKLSRTSPNWMCVAPQLLFGFIYLSFLHKRTADFVNISEKRQRKIQGGVRTHDLSVLVAEGSTRCRRHGHCNRLLTCRNRTSYIQDGHTATLQTPHFIYFFNKYTY
jgi:hypothetical protein